MPVTCGICGHPSREDIDEALAGDATQAAVAREFGVSADAVSRHVRGGHLRDANVTPISSPRALLASDLGRRGHALLSLADAEVRRAEKGPVTARLRAAKGQRASIRLTQRHRREAYRGGNPAGPAEQAELEAAWVRAVGTFEDSVSWQERLAALEGMREALDMLHRASPPSGAQLVHIELQVGDKVTEGTFWTSDPKVLAASGTPIKLSLPGLPRRDRGPDGH
jgi:hypothetical protein